MGTPVIALTIFAGFVTVTWLLRHGELSRAAADANVLRPRPAGDAGADLPGVSIVIAAKDEQEAIEACVRGWMSQDYPDFELVVVNDRSVDGTADILARLQREFPRRLAVLNVSRLADGWTGKSHAAWTGVQHASKPWLLFSDADCEVLSQWTLRTAVQFATDRGVELLSVIPTVVPRCAAERLLQPVCSGVLMLWHRPERVNDPRRAVAYANGAFMLVRRAGYDRIGGHEAVRRIVCEDMALARCAKAGGLRLFVIRGSGLYRTHMYDSFAEAWNGWTRIFQGSLQRARRLVLAMVVLAAFSLSPWVLLLVGVGGAVSSPSGMRGSWTALAVAGGLAAVALQSVMLRYYRMLGLAGWRSLMYPAGALVCVGILTSAAVKAMGIGTTYWSGTRYAHRAA